MFYILHFTFNIFYGSFRNCVTENNISLNRLGYDNFHGSDAHLFL